MESETPRQEFLRNSQELVHNMRAVALRKRRQGDPDSDLDSKAIEIAEHLRSFIQEREDLVI
jgi:hypothetical protein